MNRPSEMAFADKFRQRRLQAGLTQTEVAEGLEKLGIKTQQGYISDIERGRYVPGEPHRRALAEVIGMTDDEMEGLIVEAKLEELGLTDPAFTLMFKDIPNMTPEEKASLLRVYLEDILPGRRAREQRRVKQEP